MDDAYNVVAMVATTAAPAAITIAVSVPVMPRWANVRPCANIRSRSRIILGYSPDQLSASPVLSTSHAREIGEEPLRLLITRYGRWKGPDTGSAPILGLVISPVPMPSSCLTDAWV